MVQGHVQAWKFLQAQVAKVKDPVLRNAMMAEFRKRALNEWGFDPDSGRLATKDDAVLDAWEQELADDISEYALYGVDTRVEKRKATAKEARVRMMDFVAHGGNLEEIPEDVRSDTIDRLYYECLLAHGDQVCAEVDAFIAGGMK